VPDHDGIELMPDARVPARDFIPVELLGPIVASRQLPGVGEQAPEAAPAPIVAPIETEPAVAERTSLFGDLEAY
jgi:hypothetical protein